MFVEKKRGITYYGSYKKDIPLATKEDINLINLLEEKGNVSGKVLNYGKDGLLKLNILGKIFILKDIKESFKTGEILFLELAKNPDTHITSITIKKNHDQYINAKTNNFLFLLKYTESPKSVHMESDIIHDDRLKLADYFLKLLYRSKDHDSAKRLAFLLSIEHQGLDLILYELRNSTKITQIELNKLKPILELTSAQFSDDEVHNNELLKNSFRLIEILLLGYRRNFSIKPVNEELSIADKIYNILKNGTTPLTSRLENNFNNIFQSEYKIIPFFHFIKGEYKHFALFAPKHNKKRFFLKSNLFDKNTIISILLDDSGMTFLCDNEASDDIKNSLLAPHTTTFVKFLVKDDNIAMK
ncbi:hypothetical protein Cyrtocomes_00285 [Candidatus Cyrtobacter comes]|uniref:Uncharacterized protein n=1 Tax=Candidatus Cyrtobacter comes TaxID=675776 RepID=A0ABU5L725_9RICK|nr:hypothetical protein [Candidatus Cyrtobacter comes]